MVKIKLSQMEYTKMMASKKGAPPKDTQNIKTYYGQARPLEEAPKRHLERRELNRQIREKEKSESTPLGRVEKKVTGKAHVTSTGRGFVHKAREVHGAVRERIAPVRTAAQPFVADIRTMFSAPKHPQPIINMPPASYYGGIPNYFSPARQPRQSKKRGKKERDYEPESPWESMSGIPEYARRWMM